MKIYIAGKISGDPHYLEKFCEWENLLAEQGHSVLNPACLPDDMEPADYMRICFAMIDTADRVLFLPGWEGSFGAAVELDWCKYTGKRYLFSEELDGGDPGRCGAEGEAWGAKTAMGDCEYCKEDDCKICKNRGSHVYCIDAEPFPDCPYFERMKFCPECGRELGEEEVDNG